MAAVLTPIVLAACYGAPDKEDWDSETWDDTSCCDTDDGDADGDGWSAEDDCDDNDAAVNPGAEESCNGLDDDCDGEIDEGVTETWYADADQDGYGDENATVELCSEDPLSDYVPTAGDCDDTDMSVYPGASETTAEECADKVDNDCDGAVDSKDDDCLTSGDK